MGTIIKNKKIYVFFGSFVLVPQVNMDHGGFSTRRINILWTPDLPHQPELIKGAQYWNLLESPRESVSYKCWDL